MERNNIASVRQKSLNSSTPVAYLPFLRPDTATKSTLTGYYYLIRWTCANMSEMVPDGDMAITLQPNWHNVFDATLHNFLEMS